MKFTGKIVRGEQVILDNISGEIQMRTNGWSGFIILSATAPLLDGYYMLELHDGRKGRIIFGTYSLSQTNPIIPFTGSGVLK